MLNVVCNAIIITLQAYFEAVREAQRVTVDAIPMPDGPTGLFGDDDAGALPADIPLPMAPSDAKTPAPFSIKINPKPATGILKPSNALKSSLPAEVIAKKRKNPPGEITQIRALFPPFFSTFPPSLTD